MCYLNEKSDVYYISKMVAFKPLNLAKVHLVDDDCNEWIATVTGINHSLGYVSPSEIRVIDYEEYSADKWADMVMYIEYERAILLGGNA